MFDLFISYARPARPWAARLYGDLGKYYPEIKFSGIATLSPLYQWVFFGLTS